MRAVKILHTKEIKGDEIVEIKIRKSLTHLIACRIC
jgi:hypothetical protein